MNRVINYLESPNLVPNIYFVSSANIKSRQHLFVPEVRYYVSQVYAE